MGRSLQIRFDRRAIGLLLVFGVTTFALPAPAQTPPDPAATSKSDPAPPPAQSPSSTNPDSNASSGGEVSSRDTAPTFKVRVNLVLVRVVVRDSQGNIITNLKKRTSNSRTIASLRPSRPLASKLRSRMQLCLPYPPSTPRLQARQHHRLWPRCRNALLPWFSTTPIC